MLWTIQRAQRVTWNDVGLVALETAKGKSDFTIHTRGRFKIVTADGVDLTPKNRKARGIIALLALSSDARRSRLWLQSLLWSVSPPEKAAANLRTTLKVLRREFRDAGKLLEADRNEVWLSSSVHINDGSGRGELLELVDAPDPAFDDWLRDIRTADCPKPVLPKDSRNDEAKRPGKGAAKTLVVVRSNTIHPTQLSGFLDATMMDAISARFESEGADRVFSHSEPKQHELSQASLVLHVELTSVVENGIWAAHLRTLADKDRRFLWSGRLQVALDAGLPTFATEISGFVSRAVTQVGLRYHSFRATNHSPLMVMTRAAARLYEPKLAQVIAAEKELATVEEGEGAAVALAWQGFAKLIHCLEFRNQSESETSESLVNAALKMRPGNALINALAARVAMDISGDLDRADYLAGIALGADDDNPYALQAAARIDLKRGKTERAHRLATQARAAANGMTQAFAWDIELCLTSLAQHDFEGAQDAARLAHHANTHHRASLRYLIATSLLVGDMFEAKHAAQRLERMEDGFEIGHLFSEDYPVHTLHNLDLTGEMRKSL